MLSGGAIQLQGDSASPAAGSYYGTNGSGTLGYYSLAGTEVTSVTGTANQVLVNGTSGSAQGGAIILTLPQSIGTSSTVQFGGVGVGASLNSGDLLDLTASTVGIGTVTVSATGTSVTGSGTLFTRQLRVGDTITIVTSFGTETKTISALTNDTTITVSVAWSGNASNASFTLVGGIRAQMLQNGTLLYNGSATSPGITVLMTDSSAYTNANYGGIRIQNQLSVTDGGIHTFLGSLFDIGVVATTSDTGSTPIGIEGIVGFLATNTQNWTTTVASAVCGQVNSSSGATGTVTGAYAYRAILNSSTTSAMTFTRVYGYGVANCGQATGASFTYAASFASVAPAATVSNYTGLLLGTLTIPTGNFGIYDNTGYAWYSSCSTASTSTTTGCAIFNGGIGIAGALFTGGNVATAGYFDSTVGSIPSPGSGHGYYAGHTTYGAFISGNGATNDITLNSTAGIVLSIAHNTLNAVFTGTLSGAGITVTGNNDITWTSGYGLAVSSTRVVGLTNGVVTVGVGLAISQGQFYIITSTATAGTTTTLTSTSTVIQIFTGSQTQNVALPAASAVASGTGIMYVFKNKSTQPITIYANGTDLIEGASSTIVTGLGNSITMVSDGTSAWNLI